MRYLVAIFILFAGCSSFAEDKYKEPSGEELFDALLKSMALDLSKEPLCDVGSATRNKNHLTLGEHLATALSLSYKNNNKLTLKSTCSLSKHEQPKNNIIDAWDCNLLVNESNAKNEFISSSTIAFNLSLDKLSVLKGSLRCF